MWIDAPARKDEEIWDKGRAARAPTHQYFRALKTLTPDDQRTGVARFDGAIGGIYTPMP